MSFWNFIGLSSKSDIENINRQLEDMKNLINTNIIKETDDVKSKIINLENENTKNRNIVFEELEKLTLQISNLDKKSEQNIMALNETAEKVYKDIEKAIGLSSKTDTENINKQLEDMKNLINTSIIKETSDVKNKITNFEDKNIKNQNIIVEELERATLGILNLDKKSEQNIISLNEITKKLYTDIESLKTLISNVEILTNNDNKAIKQINKNLKDSQKQIETVTKDLSIVQQMIRVVWVNDIIDTLEDSSKING